MVVKALFVLGLNMQFKRGNYNGNFWHHVCTTGTKEGDGVVVPRTIKQNKGGVCSGVGC